MKISTENILALALLLEKPIYIGYYTGSRSVRLDIFTSLTYFVESAGRDKIQRQVKIYSSTELDYLCNKLFIIRQINQIISFPPFILPCLSFDRALTQLSG